MGNLFRFSVPFGHGPFHVLTCVQLCLAVIHPITSRGLKHLHAARLRNGSLVCVWGFTLMSLVVCYWDSEVFIVSYCCGMSFVLLLILFCSISTLCALRGRRPGQVGGNVATPSTGPSTSSWPSWRFCCWHLE